MIPGNMEIENSMIPNISEFYRMIDDLNTIHAGCVCDYSKLFGYFL